VEVRIITQCGTPSETIERRGTQWKRCRLRPSSFAAVAMSDDNNPIAASTRSRGGYIGTPNLIPGWRTHRPSRIRTIALYATGFAIPLQG